MVVRASKCGLHVDLNAEECIYLYKVIAGELLYPGKSYFTHDEFLRARGVLH